MPSGMGCKSRPSPSAHPHTQQSADSSPPTAGTNPIHNKKPKKKVTEEDDEDKAFKAKQQAGTSQT